MSATLITESNADAGRVEVLIMGRTGAAVLYADDGTGPRPVRGANPIPDSLPDPVVVYDYEAPARRPITYTLTDSAGTTTATGYLDTSSAWLVHPTLPYLSRPVTVLDQPSSEWRGRGSEFDVMDRAFPLVLTYPRASREGRVRLVVNTGPERDALLALIADGSVLLLRSPCPGRVDDARWMFLRDVSESPLGNPATSERRVWELDYRVTDSPSGGQYLDPLWTYADVVTSFATYGEVATTAPTYWDLLTATLQAAGQSNAARAATAAVFGT